MAKQKKPAPSGRKGGNGAGNTKTIAKREQQQRDAQARRSSVQKRLRHGAIKRAERPVEETSVFTLHDVVDGTAKTGNLFEVAGSTFELTLEAGKQAFILKKGGDGLSQWSDQAGNVFVLVQDLLREDYTPRLRGPLADKQGLMWKTAASAMDEDMVDVLAARLKRDMQAARQAEDEALEAERFTGPAEAPVWVSAISDPSRFAEAVEGLKADTSVALRIGVTSDAGAVIAVSYRDDGMQIKPVHIGKNCSMAGKVLKGAYLRCRAGRLDEEKPKMFGELGESVCAIWEFMMNPEIVDRIGVRDPLMHGMYHAYRRLHNQPLKVVGGTQGKPSTLPVVAQATTVVATSAPAEATISPPNKLSEFVKSLHDVGLSAAEIGVAVAEYTKTMRETDSKSA
jgi:hypothetical protein